jgi:hypothetical protein
MDMDFSNIQKIFSFNCNFNASTKIYNRFIDIISYPSLYKRYAIVCTTSHQTKLVKLFTGGNIIICLVYSISVCCAGLNSSAFTLPNLATLSANDKHTTSSSILERYILPKIYKITRVNWHKSHR